MFGKKTFKSQTPAVRIIQFIIFILAMMALFRGTGEIMFLAEAAAPKRDFGRKNKPKAQEEAKETIPGSPAVTSEDPELAKLIKDVKIEYKAKDHYGKVAVSQKEYDAVCNKIAEQVRANLKYAINSQVLKKVLKSKNHKIIIYPPNSPSSFEGAYMASQNAILIRWNANLTDEQIRNLLMNDVHHNAICKQRLAGNEFIEEIEDCVVLPDPEAYGDVLKQGNDKIKKYEKLFIAMLNSGNFLQEPSPEMKELLAAAVCYEPFVHPLNVENSNHQRLFKDPRVQKLKDGVWYVPPNVAPVGGTFQREGFYLRFKPLGNGQMLYQMTFTNDKSAVAKARAFFLDKEIRVAKYQAGYNVFASKSPAHAVTEQVSDVENLPPALQKLFFPGVCALLEKFHGVDNYCERPIVCNRL